MKVLVLIAIFLVSCNKASEHSWNDNLSEVTKLFSESLDIETVIWKRNHINQRNISVPGPESSITYGYLKLRQNLNIEVDEKVIPSFSSDLPDAWKEVHELEFFKVSSLIKKYEKADGSVIFAYSPKEAIMYFEIGNNFSNYKRKRRSASSIK